MIINYHGYCRFAQRGVRCNERFNSNCNGRTQVNNVNWKLQLHYGCNGCIVSCGAALGSMFGQQLFRNVSAFTMTIIAGALSFLTTLSTLSAHIYAVLPFFFLLAATASISSIKLTQWLVNTVEHKILASTVAYKYFCNSIITCNDYYFYYCFWYE